MKRYRISEFSKRSGISADTLRFYEKTGLLHPCHQAENNYRMYSDYDLLELMQLRLMRSMGMPISALKKQGTQNLDELYASVNTQAEALQAEIAVLTGRLERFRRIQQELEECKTRIGEYVIHELPPLYALYYDEESTRDPRFAQQVAAWCEHIPYVHLTCRLPAAELAKPAGETLNAVPGIGMLADYAASCGITPAAPAVTMLPEKNLRILLCIRDPLHPTREELAPAFALLSRLHLRSTGDWYFRLRFMERTPDGDMRCYVALRFVVEDI